MAEDTDLSFTRTLPVSREKVFTCWTTPEHLKQFFVPRPHKVLDCVIDLRPGGAFNTTFDIDGTVMENGGVWLEVIPNEKLVFTDGYTTGWKPSPERFMTAIIELSDAPDGGTVYTATARHANAETAQRHKDMGFYEGWGTVVDQLVEYAQTLD